ncbi:MAG: PrsW family glutamic-type intramembrane protease, partial [Gemmataceae bacterium]
IEESVKLLVVVLAVFWRADFDEPVDGLIYGTAAALGFTFAEDLRYFTLFGASWARVLTVMAHPWFSCFWAGALGEAKVMRPWKGIPLVLLGLAISAFVHGLFDFLVKSAHADPAMSWLTYLFVPLAVILYWAVEHQLEAQPAVKPRAEGH